MARIAGTIFLKRNGIVYPVAGAFAYNVGVPENEMLVGHDYVHGHKEMPRVPFVEGEMRDTGTYDLEELLRSADNTIQLDLANGWTITLAEAVPAGEWTGNTEESTLSARFEGQSATRFRRG